MDEEILQELKAEMLGIRQILAMIITELPADLDLRSRLQNVEDNMRTQNIHSMTIETVRSFRLQMEEHQRQGDALDRAFRGEGAPDTERP